jgi:uncharacterized membrane protein
MGKSLLNFLRTTLVGGALFLVPIVVLVIIIEKALGIAHRFSDPIAARFPVLAEHTPILLAIILLVIVCFLFGLLARIGAARTSVAWLENTILSKLPGYSFIKGASQSVLSQDQTAYPVVLARIEDAWQFGFVIEKLASGHLAVFVPDAPNPMSGSVYFMGPDRVRPTELTMGHALMCLRQLGAGAGSRLPPLDFDDGR